MQNAKGKNIMDWERFKKEEKNDGVSAHYMVLTKHLEICQKALKEIGSDSDLNRMSTARISRKKITWRQVFAALKNFFTPDADDEIFKWVPIEKLLLISGTYVNECKIIIGSDDIHGPGVYDVGIITLR